MSLSLEITCQLNYKCLFNLVFDIFKNAEECMNIKHINLHYFRQRQLCISSHTFKLSPFVHLFSSLLFNFQHSGHIQNILMAKESFEIIYFTDKEKLE